MSNSNLKELVHKLYKSNFNTDSLDPVIKYASNFGDSIVLGGSDMPIGDKDPEYSKELSSKNISVYTNGLIDKLLSKDYLTIDYTVNCVATKKNVPLFELGSESKELLAIKRQAFKNVMVSNSDETLINFNEFIILGTAKSQIKDNTSFIYALSNIRKDGLLFSKYYGDLSVIASKSLVHLQSSKAHINSSNAYDVLTANVDDGSKLRLKIWTTMDKLKDMVYTSGIKASEGKWLIKLTPSTGY
jgi:hypothetical protein